MEQFKTVKVIDGGEQKGSAEIEAELLAKKEAELAAERASAAPAGAGDEGGTEGAGSGSGEGDKPDDDIEESKVLAFISKRYNKQINSLDDLAAERKEADPLPEDVASFLKYKKDTGRGIDDFMRLQKDHDKMPEDQLLKEYLTATQDGLDSEDIEMMMDDYRFDEVVDEESRVKKVKIERKKAINEAKKFFNTQKEKYKTPLESSAAGLSLEEQQEFNSYREYTAKAKTIEEENNRKRKWFDQKTDEVFSNEFKGFEFDVEGKKITFTPSEAKELKKLQSNPQNFIAKFIDQKSGLISDPVGYHKALAIAMNPDKFAKFFYQQGAADATVGTMKVIKNINMTERKVPEVQPNKDGIQVKAVNPDSGKGLKIRSIKKV